MAALRPIRKRLASTPITTLRPHPSPSRAFINTNFQTRRSIVYKYKRIPSYNNLPRASKSAVLVSNIKKLLDARFEPAEVVWTIARSAWKFLKYTSIGFVVFRMHFGVMDKLTGWKIGAEDEDDGIDEVEA